MHKRQGFTIVELLIVIVVIAILAAITIVAYNGIQNRSKSTQFLAAIDAYIKAAEIYKYREWRLPGYATTA
jgi:prepilin-type N-terminal cleavage/methylation domain-containing protein